MATRRSVAIAAVAAVATFVLVLGSSVAAAQTLHWQATPTLSVAGTNPNDALYATPRGGAYDGVAVLFIERSDIAPGFGVLCTGALLQGGRDILTAAHCLSSGGVVTTTRVTAVFFPPGQPATFREFVVATAPWAFSIHESYTGEVIDQH
ncbi:MAG: hypothetical protein ACRENU_10010, partial [Gemmatimonadaceae bacterium]